MTYIELVTAAREKRKHRAAIVHAAHALTISEVTQVTTHAIAQIEDEFFAEVIAIDAEHFATVDHIH